MTNIKKFIVGMIDNKQKFTDIHILDGDAIRFRTLGEIKTYSPRSGEIKIDKNEIFSFLDESLQESEMESRDFRKELEESGGDLDFAITCHANRFRCNMAWVGGSKKISLSLRKLNPKAVALSELELPKIVTDFANRSKGLILVTGQTGSGKSTTMAGIIEHVKELNAGKIITIEDPIEYVFYSGKSMIVQREVGEDTKSFAKSLRAALRQDPDVIMIGELRDRETMEAALSAAETGHLVISTLHTNSARQTVERVLSFFEGDERALAMNVLSSVLIGIVSQSLIARKDGSGLTLGYEILVNTPAIAQLIRDPEKTGQIQNLLYTGQNQGMITFNRCLSKKIQSGEISQKDAFYTTYDRLELKKELDSAGIPIEPGLID
jgi:twitching motility protein PilT